MRVNFLIPQTEATQPDLSHVAFTDCPDCKNILTWRVYVSRAEGIEMPNPMIVPRATSCTCKHTSETFHALRDRVIALYWRITAPNDTEPIGAWLVS